MWRVPEMGDEQPFGMDELFCQRIRRQAAGITGNDGLRRDQIFQLRIQRVLELEPLRDRFNQ
jgi:hypothetical protein